MRSRALIIAKSVLLIWGGAPLLALFAVAGLLTYQSRFPDRAQDGLASFRMTSWSHPPVQDPNAQQKMQIEGFSAKGDKLYGHLMFANFTDDVNIPDAVVIRGTQLPDGSFWPYLRLEVGSDRDGPWKSIGSVHLEGSEISLTVPPSILVSALRADLRPFRPYLADMAWGRVSLPTGQSALIDLKELPQ